MMTTEPTRGTRFAGRPLYPVREDTHDEAADLGAIQIHNGVIATIARLAATTVSGVADMAGSLVDGLAGLVSRKTIERGVHVETVDNNLILDVHVALYYGEFIPKVAYEVQQAVREAVSRMTGKSVKSVNVLVQNVVLPPASADTASGAGEDL
jgi:uncharacterized alkaline shock family protein YloU